MLERWPAKAVPYRVYCAGLSWCCLYRIAHPVGPKLITTRDRARTRCCQGWFGAGFGRFLGGVGDLCEGGLLEGVLGNL